MNEIPDYLDGVFNFEHFGAFLPVFTQSLGEKGFHKNPGHVFCFAVVSHSGGSHERYSQIFGWGFQF